MKPSFWGLALAGLLAIGCSTLPPTQADVPKLTPAKLDRVERLLKDEIGAKRMPGAVVQVWHGGNHVRTLVAGHLDPDNSVPMREDAVFRIYSMTKPIVSVAIMMLVEEGRVALAGPVSAYIPELKDLKVAEPAKAGAAPGEPVLVPAQRQPTVHDLLKHTAGFTYGGQPGHVPRLYDEAGIDLDLIDSKAFLQKVAALPLSHHPGSAWEYGVSTDILGLVVERVSGQPLEVFLRERIFVPLRMTDTAFVVDASQRERVARPFSKNAKGDAITLWDVHQPRKFNNGGGGLVSTAGDFMRFARMMLNRGELDGTRILSRKSVELMTADHLNGVTGPNAFFGPGHGFGLGFAVRTHAGVAHSLGSVGDYFWVGYAGTMFWIDPKEQLIVVLMTQAPGMHWRNMRTHRNLIYSLMD